MAKDIGNLRTRLSFEKTGDSNITDLKRDLRGVQSEMNNFRSSSRGYRTSVQGMKQESDILTRRLNVQRETVAELKRRYEESKRVNGENAAKTKELAAQYNNAQAEMKRTQGQLERLNGLIKTQESRWTQLGQKMQDYGGKLRNMGDKATQFGRSYSMRVTAPITAAGLAALKVGMDFEEGMSKVQAISGATGDQLEAMRDQAKELGETTRFSATEAANGMEFLARAGWETEEIMAGMPGLLDLAASSAMDLGRAADITSNIMSAFNIEAENAGYVADVLAHAAANANTDVEQMGEAMKYVAPTANTLGLGIEDTAAAIMAVSDAGIQGSQAGRAFGTSLLRLSNPTKKMSDEMDKLKVNFFDANGVIKPLPQIIEELEGAMDGYNDQQKAAALSTIFGTEAQRHWAILLDTGSDALAKNSKELKNSEGAAAEMAEIMQDNAKGAIIELKSALEGAGIAISEHVIPTVTDFVRWVTDLVRKFGELDESQQKQILKWAGIVAAIGPASLAIGGVAKVTGGFLTAGGKLFTLMGKASGAGLIGRFAAMGSPAGPVLLTAGALALVGTAAYNLIKDKEKLHKITTETADKFNDQADELEKLVTEYDKLELKSKLTNDEFGRMIDIQQELEGTQNPARVAELKEEYEYLREKSDLTNEEIEKMIGLNDNIIEQSPNVEKSFTDKGNAVVESTDAIHEYIQSLRDMAMIELQAERVKALENEAKLLEQKKELNEEIAGVEEDINELIAMRDIPLSEVDARIEEINEKLRSGQLTQEEFIELEREQDLLLQHQNGSLAEALTALQEQRSELNEKINKNEEELAKLEEINVAIADNLLAEVDLTFEKGKGLEKLDERIQKYKDERKEIMENATEQELASGVYSDQLDLIDDAIRKHEDVRDRIYEETEYQSEQNSKLDKQNEAIETAKKKFRENIKEIKEQGKVQSLFNKRIDKGTSKAEKQNKVLGAGVTKNVEVDDKGTAKKVSDEASRNVTKTVTVNAVAGAGLGIAGTLIPGYATGTDSHPGGPFVAGEKGWELGRLGNRWEVLNAGLYDRPKNYEVFTHDESKRLLRSLNNMPAYANGTNMGAETNRLLKKTNDRAPDAGQPIILEVHVTSEIDGRVAGETVEKYVTEIQERNKKVVGEFAQIYDI